VIQLDQMQLRPHELIDQRIGKVRMHLKRKRHVLPYGERIQQRTVLKHHPDMLQQGTELGLVHFEDLPTEQPDLS